MACCGRHKHPDITDEMHLEINAIIQKYKDKPGSLISVLRLCQDVVGYLPIQLINKIADGLNIPGSEVFGVVSFYSLFLLEPKGRNKIKLCMGTACYVKGIKEIKNRISNEFKIEDGENTEDMRYSLESVRCVGACSLAPIVIVNEDTHGSVSADKIISVLGQYE